MQPDQERLDAATTSSMWSSWTLRPADLAPEDCELVAKDQDLDIAVASIGSASHEHEGDQPAQEQGEGRRAKSTGGASFPGEGPILQRPCSPA